MSNALEIHHLLQVRDSSYQSLEEAIQKLLKLKKNLTKLQRFFSYEEKSARHALFGVLRGNVLTTDFRCINREDFNTLLPKLLSAYVVAASHRYQLSAEDSSELKQYVFLDCISATLDSEKPLEIAEILYSDVQQSNLTSAEELCDGCTKTLTFASASVLLSKNVEPDFVFSLCSAELNYIPYEDSSKSSKVLHHLRDNEKLRDETAFDVLSLLFDDDVLAALEGKLIDSIEDVKLIKNRTRSLSQRRL